MRALALARQAEAERPDIVLMSEECASRLAQATLLHDDEQREYAARLEAIDNLLQAAQLDAVET